jgi:protocatechuate 3,4-dioxygenase alpha subunit
VLNLIDLEVRRSTLISKREAKDGKTVYTLDIRLQGDNETVFFDI